MLPRSLSSVPPLYRSNRHLSDASCSSAASSRGTTLDPIPTDYDATGEPRFSDSRHTAVQSIDSRTQQLLIMRTRHNLTVAPIGKLPPEIIAAIFLFCSDTDIPGRTWRDWRTNHRSPLGWLSVTHVCRRWREIALDTVVLWRKPVFSLGQRCFDSMIERSQSTPLTLVIPNQPYDMDWIVPEETTIKAVDVNGVMQCTKELSLTVTRLKTVLFFHALTENAPILEKLSLMIGVRHRPFPPRFLGNNTPKLRHLSLSGVSESLPWTANLFHNLVSLKMHLDLLPHHTPRSPTVCEDALAAFVNLGTLEILHLGHAFVCTDASHRHTDRRPLVRLPHLTHLRVVMWSDYCTHVLCYLDVPATAQIDISVWESDRGDQAFLESEAGFSARFSFLSRYLGGAPVTTLTFRGSATGRRAAENAELKLEAWRATPDQSMRDRDRAPDICVKFRPNHQGTRPLAWDSWTKTLCRFVRWGHVDTLRVLDKWDRDTWARMWPSLKAVKKLEVAGIAAYHFCDFVQARDMLQAQGAMEPILPSLLLLRLHRLDFSNPPERKPLQEPVSLSDTFLLKWFKARAEIGKPLRCLLFTTCKTAAGEEVSGSYGSKKGLSD